MSVQLLTADHVRVSGNARSLNRHALLATVAIMGLFGGIGAWSATTQIAGAVVAGGLVVVESGSQKVQHQEGGIVKQIYADNEDRVEAGEVLVRLDDTTINANLEVVVSQLREAFARQSRLIAESTNATAMVPPPLAKDWPADPELAALYKQQDLLRVSRLNANKAQVDRLNEQASQLELQIKGYEAQQVAIKAQLDILKNETTGLDDLLSKGLTQAARVNELKRNQAELEGEMGRIDAEIAGARAAIAERKVAAGQVVEEFQSQVLTDLQDVGQKIAELMQQKIAAEDRLARLDIRSPATGVVHESTIHTVGGVVTPGETLMLVVPQDNHLLLDTRVSPLDIDKLSVDQAVVVRMSSLDARTTPELNATIKSISPDLVRDQVTGAQYYVVRVDVPDAEVERLPQGTKLVPGMPAEAFIQTGERTVLEYLVHPLAEQLNRVFRED